MSARNAPGLPSATGTAPATRDTAPATRDTAPATRDTASATTDTAPATRDSTQATTGTARTAAAGARTRVVPRGEALGGLLWAVWRRHRGLVRAAVVLLVVTAGWLLWLRWAMTDYVGARDLSGCSATHHLDGCSAQAQAAVDHVRTTYGYQLMGLGIALGTLMPPLVAAVVAGSLIARETESGTYRMAWTQSVSPTRWLAATLALPTAAVIVGGGLLSVLFQWTWNSVDHDLTGLPWHDAYVYDAIGPAPVARGLLAVAVGALAGLLLRRTSRARYAAVLGGGLLAGVVSVYVRPLLMPRLTESSPGYPELDADAWTVESGHMTATGGRLPADVCDGAGVGDSYQACMDGRGVTDWYVDYHPASHLWPLQALEAGVVLALAAVLAATAFRIMRRRHG
ncbi:ABC transporter permease [Streptomyces sp. URMC 123]|uniref:ABC transporter permease n=1 Tax=Streptomyces sp. URMC 123 TaxID=3423403 RepID=UPI003F1AFDF4